MCNIFLALFLTLWLTVEQTGRAGLQHLAQEPQFFDTILLQAYLSPNTDIQTPQHQSIDLRLSRLCFYEHSYIAVYISSHTHADIVS